jgi:hypothetical protein
MARRYTWSDEDWYKTAEYIFAGDDEHTLKKEKLLDIFKHYYNKFKSNMSFRKIPIDPIHASFLPKSMATLMFEGEAQFPDENMSKIELFVSLLKSFSMEEQYEILRRLFDEQMYIDDGYDSLYLQAHIDRSDYNYESVLMRQYEPLLKSQQDNTDEKRNILANLFRELEPLREDMESINKKYTNLIFSMGNNLHIRHNNKEGEKRNEIVDKMKEKELASRYDDLYMLIKIMMNWLRDKDFYKHYDERDRIKSEFDSINRKLKKRK